MTKNLFKKLFIAFLIFNLIIFLISFIKTINIYNTKHSLFSTSKNLLTNISNEDQEKIIKTFMIQLPDDEDISICGFNKNSIDVENPHGFYVYSIDFNGVENIDGFIDLNKNILNQNIKFDPMSKDEPDRYFPALIVLIDVGTENDNEYYKNIINLYSELAIKYKK